MVPEEKSSGPGRSEGCPGDLRERESCEWVFQCEMSWKAGMQRSFRDGSQRVPFLVPIQVDQTSSIECQSVILVFAFNNTRRGRLAG